MGAFDIYCDGGSRGNPGPAASAFAVFKGKENIHTDSEYLGKNTNNVAEYNSLLMALRWIEKNLKSEDSASITLDSQLVYKQMMGEYRIKNKTLMTYAKKIKELEIKFSGIIFYKWSPRKHNKTADALVNEKLDEKSL